MMKTIKIGLPIAMVCVLLLLTVGALLYPSLQQLSLVSELESMGAQLTFDDLVDIDGKEVRTWSLLEEWLLPREAYATPHSVDMREVEIVGEGELSLVARLRDVRRVNLGGTNVSSDDLLVLADMPQLRILSLRNTTIGDDAIDSLSKIRSLSGLDLAGTNISEAAILKLESELPECKVKDYRNRWPWSRRDR